MTRDEWRLHNQAQMTKAQHEASEMKHWTLAILGAIGFVIVCLVTR